MGRLFHNGHVHSLRLAAVLLGALAVLAATISTSSAVVVRASTGVATATSDNLLLGAKGNFDGSTGGWVAFTGASLADVSNPVQAGTGAMSVTNPTASTLDEWFGSGSGPASLTPAIGNQTYTGSVFVQAATTGRTVGSLLAFYSATGSMLGSAFGQTSVDAPGTWSPVSPVVAVAPAATAFVGLGLIFYGAAPGEVHYVDSASVTATTGAALPIVGSIRTSGNTIVDATGRTVVLRGVYAGWSDASTAQVPNDAAIAGIQRWRANLVRVPLAESLWVNTCPLGTATNDPAYPSAIDAEIQSITSRGMVALLDLQRSVITPCGTSSQHRMADAPYSIPFWQQVAARYKSNGLVAFDLYTEPHDISSPVWRNGGLVTEAGGTFNAAGMQQLYDAVRSTGANNVVTISGNTYAGDPSPIFQGYGVAGTNIAYAIHAYTCPHDNDPSCSANPANQTQRIDSRWSQVGAYFPIVITEFGFPSTMSGGGYNASVIRYAESQGWGWSAFHWVTVAPNGPFDLNADAGPNWEPRASGMPVLAGMAAD